MADDVLFRSVGIEGRLVDRVVDQIQQMIIQGGLEPGTKLPSEREMAEQLGVSRTAMREAVHILVARGLLQSKRGVGTTVRQVTSGQVAEPLRLVLQAQGDSISVNHLHQVRSILEVAIAELAAQQATAEDTAALQQSLERMEWAQDDSVQFALCDTEFHRALAQATHNPLLILLLDSIRDLMQEVREAVAGYPGLPGKVMPFHQRIADRVFARGAGRAMRSHIEQAREIQEAVAEQGKERSAGSH